MLLNPDMIVVLVYFVIIILLGGKVTRKHKKDSLFDYLNGGKDMGWFRTSMTLIATSINVGIIGFVGIGFVWGMAIQPNAVNLWFSAPLLALFFLPIFWRTKIVTISELLEKRFNLSSRILYSLISSLKNIIILGTSLYLGGFMLEYFFGWNLYFSCIAILLIVGLLNYTGGMKAILTIDFYQGVFVSVIFLLIGFIMLYQVGGLSAFMKIHILSEANKPLPSIQLPFDLSPFSTKWFAMPFGIIWAMLAGASWMAGNFTIVQRLLAAKNEEQAQKAAIFTGFGNVLSCFIAYIIGVSVRVLHPEILHPDQAYLVAIADYIPLGVRGLIIVGMVAGLVSTINGLITSTTSLFIEDVYLRLIKPTANDGSVKIAAHFVQVIILVLSMLLIPLSSKEFTITRLIQDLVSIPMSVTVSLLGLGVFSTTIKPNAAFFGTVAGIAISLIILFMLPAINFWTRGVVGSFTVILVAIVLSFFEKKPVHYKLDNLTIFTFKGSTTPYVGTIAWKNIIWWMVGIQILWLCFTITWESFIG